MYNFAFFTIGESILRPDVEESNYENITNLFAGAEVSTIKLLAEEMAEDFDSDFVSNVIQLSTSTAFELNPDNLTELFENIQNELGLNAEAELRKKAIKEIQSTPNLIKFINGGRPSNAKLCSYWDGALKERTKYQGFTRLNLDIALILTEGKADPEAERKIDLEVAEKLRKSINGKYIKVRKGREYRIYIRFFYEEREKVIEGLSMKNAERFKNVGTNKLSSYIEETSVAIRENKLTLKSANMEFKRQLKMTYVVSGGFKGVIPLLTLQAQLRGCEIKYKHEGLGPLITIPALPIGFNIENEMEFAYWLGHKEVIKGDVLKRMRECGLIEIVDGVVELSAFGRLMREDISVNLAAGTHIGKMIEFKIFRELSSSVKLIQSFCKISDRITSWKTEHGVKFNSDYERINYDTDNKGDHSDIDVLVVFSRSNKRRTILAVESKMDSVFVEGWMEETLEQSEKHMGFLHEEAKRQSKDNYIVDIVYALTISTAAINSDYLSKVANVWVNAVKENAKKYERNLLLKVFAINLMKKGKVNYSSFMDSKIVLQPVEKEDL